MTKNIPIMTDFENVQEAMIGVLTDTNIKAQAVFDLMKQGYVFEVAPTIKCDGINPDGTYINPELISVSLITSSGRKQIEA